jgi:hypothetical protein
MNLDEKNLKKFVIVSGLSLKLGIPVQRVKHGINFTQSKVISGIGIHWIILAKNVKKNIKVKKDLRLDSAQMPAKANIGEIAA